SRASTSGWNRGGRSPPVRIRSSSRSIVLPILRNRSIHRPSYFDIEVLSRPPANFFTGWKNKERTPALPGPALSCPHGLLPLYGEPPPGLDPGPCSLRKPRSTE